jgi:tetratricopeptide (TPR) repeat protein
MYFNEGVYNRALPLFEAILSAQVRRFSALHPSVGAAMHNVGVCRQRLGQHDLAENLFSEAVQIRQQTLGPDHLDVAASLSKMGATRVALKKFNAAHENLLQALSIARTSLGAEHKTVAQILAHLGCFYFEVGELYASQATFQDALAIYRVAWSRTEESGRDSCMAQLTDTLCNIGSIQNRRKGHTNAIESFSEALDLQRGILGHDDPRVIATLDNLGYSYSKHKDYASALSCYRKLLRAQISRSGTFTEECFESFRKQLLMYEKLKRIPEAVNETKEIIQLQKTMLYADHALITKTKQLLKSLQKKNERCREKASVEK